jgi:hypothetical protein
VYHPGTGKVVAHNESGFSRYLVTDGFASWTIQQVVGARYDDYTREVTRVFELSNSLGTAVDHLLPLRYRA